MKVAIIEGTAPTLLAEGPVIERQILGPEVEIGCFGTIEPEDYEAALGEVSAVIVRPAVPMPREMVRAMRKARVIAMLGVGFDKVCLEATREQGIPVCNVPDYGAEEVADTTLAMLLAHQRKLVLFRHRFSLDRLDWDWRIHIPITRSSCMQAGLLGLGPIGMAVATRLKGFGYRLVYYDPYVPRGIGKALGLSRMDRLEELLATSDVVTVHTPLTDETMGMIDEGFLNRLKPNAILINTARGGIFTSADVLGQVLKERPGLRIASDVWPEEPPTPHPLLEAWKRGEAWLEDRLLLYPHASFYSEQSLHDLRAGAAGIVKVALSGGSPPNVVNGVTVEHGVHLLRHRR